jgi:CheY-like chemotaxis protein
VLARNGVRMLLQGWGCEVMLAASGAEAIGLAERSPPPDLLLVDYRLPDGTGPDFVEQLHRRWKTVTPVHDFRRTRRAIARIISAAQLGLPCEAGPSFQVARDDYANAAAG